MPATASNRLWLMAIISTLLAGAVLTFGLPARAAADSARNLLVNGDFSRTYAGKESPAFWQRNNPGLDKDGSRPCGWTVQPQVGGQISGPVGAIAPVREDGKSALSVTTGKGQALRLQQWVEVVPEARYTCAVSVKGKGYVSLHAYAQVPATGQDIGSANAQATADWARLQLPVKIGYHRHVAAVQVDIGENSQVLLRRAEFSAEIPACPLPETLVTTKPHRDEQTLYFEDFDGPTCSFDLGKDCKLTDANGGRFGRGLVVTPTAGGAKARLHFGKLPETGTIEFWYKPASLPSNNTELYPLSLTTPAAYKELQFLVNWWNTTVRFGFRREQWDGEDSWAHSAHLGDDGWGHWQTGSWHHVAGAWDNQAVRLYLDGALVGIRLQGGIETGWSCLPAHVERPNGDALELVLAAPGVFDEIRVSKVLRFGPVVPVGAANVPLVFEQDPSAAAAVQAGGKHLETSEKDLNNARLKLISKVPDVPQAAYVFPAAQVHPAWEGMDGMTRSKDFFGLGQDAVNLDVGREQDDWTMRPSTVYWKMTDIQPGRYYVGVWMETGGFDARLSEYSAERIVARMYLNGLTMNFSTTSDPVQVKPGLWLGELQSETSIDLKPGDELAVRPQHAWRSDGNYLRLVLYRQEPKRGHGVTGRVFGATFGPYRIPAQLKLAPKLEIAGSYEAGTKHEAMIRLSNPLPYEVKAVVDWKLADYFGAPVVDKSQTIVFAPHATVTIVEPFVARTEARAYQLDLKTRAAGDFKPPVSRGADMLEENDWTRLELLPNLTGPADTWLHIRKDLAGLTTGDRRRFSLDGSGWERGPTAQRRVSDKPPADIKWGGTGVPTPPWMWSAPKGYFGFWYRKKFQVPTWLRGQTLQLEIGRAFRRGTAFINGKRVPGECYSSIPLRTDVTGMLNLTGDNELTVLVLGDVSMSREDYIDRYNRDAWIENDGHRDYPPCDDNIATGLGEVWLRALPEVRVRQTLVLPDVDNGQVIVLSRVENTRKTPVTVELRYALWQQGKEVAHATVPSQTVTVKPGEVMETRSVGKGDGLQLYTPASPILTKLSTTVLEKGLFSSKSLDVEETRFGYRTVKVKGSGLTLNGQPITLLGTGPVVSYDIFEREVGTNTVRCLPYSMDEIDEIGRFYYPYITNSWPASEWELLNNDRYWKRDCDLGVERVWEMGSRPCVVGWDISNECYHYACFAIGEGQNKLGQRFFEVVQDVRNRTWPDFWFVSDGNESIGGRIPYTSWHYLNQNWSSIYWNGSGLNLEAHKGLQDISCYPPDCFFMDGAASEPKPTTVIHGTNQADDWRLGMPCGSTEEFWFVDANNGPAVCKFVGEKGVISTGYQFNNARGMWWGRLSIDGYRDMGASVMGVYAHNFLCTAMQAVTFDMPQQEIRFYGGSKYDHRITIHDDEFAPGKLEFAWTLLGPNGAQVAHDSKSFESTTSLLKRDRVTFDLPQVGQKIQYTLDMTLRKDGRLREHQQRTVEVWPQQPSFSAGLAVALYDPQGKAQPVLERLGCKVKPLPAIAIEALVDCRVLVIGPQCVVGNMPAEQDTIKQFTESGGKVLVLDQTANGILPGDAFLENRNFSSMGFVRASGHPVMRDLKDMDFAMWHWPDGQSSHLIARGAYRTPNRGNFLPLVECFHFDKQSSVLAWTPLWELYMGKGSIVCCQLPLVETIQTEPMAAQMLQRVLAYLGQDSYRHPQGSLAVCSNVSEPVLSRLKELRADFRIVAQPAASDPVTLLEMNQAEIKDVDSLRKYVQDGGTLLLHRARPEHQAFLAELTGKNVTVELQPYRAWVDRQVIEKRDGLAEGLSHADFYWRANISGEGPDSTTEVSTSVLEGKGQVEYVVKVDGATEYLFPGGWTELTMGKGKLVIDQVKWELPEKEKNDYGSPMRVASMLLSNLGIVQKLPALKPSLPPEVKCEPLDLASVVNRGLRDDKAGDGVGWVDWGPDMDIRDFPTGDINLDGVPFKVVKGDKNVVVLRVNPEYVKSLADYPQSVTIRVGKKGVAGLWFLHTGGWTSGLKPYAWREVYYADGTKEVMTLNNTNFADWNYGHDQFPDEEGTSTTVFWKGACKGYPITRVYKTLWVNPHPEKEIAKIVLADAGLPAAEQRFIAHLAVTVALAGEPKPGVARDSKKSQALLQEALALRQDKKTAEAAAKLAEALKADDQNVGVWVTLTEIRSASDGVDAFTALCKRWFAAMPKNYQAHNVLGKFLEAKGKPADALAEYKRSLELEWNQPPTIEARTRLEKQLNSR